MLAASALENAPALKPDGPQGQKPDLAAVLKKAADYCDKLDKVIFDFVCLEEIGETIDPLLDALKPFEMSTDWTRVPPGAGQPKKIKSTYVYDYQCIRAEGRLRERRTLIEKNGKKTNVPDATLQSASFVFGNALLAPVSLFAERYQSSYDYSFDGTENIGNIAAAVIAVKPKPGAAEAKCTYGMAWIDPATAEILRIKWRDARVGHWELFQKRGERFQRTPRLTMRADLKAEKNGFRFPSALDIEEAYVDGKGRVFVRSKVDAVYREFKFFKVDVEVR